MMHDGIKLEELLIYIKSLQPFYLDGENFRQTSTSKTKRKT